MHHIKPRKLFLIDGLGALLSAFMLGVVLVWLETIFGMPKPTLYLLALLAGIFAVYSLMCFWWFPAAHWQPLMKVIAFINLSYCGLTAFMIIYLHDKITLWGYFYFILEIIIVVLLSLIEIKTALIQSKS